MAHGAPIVINVRFAGEARCSADNTESGKPMRRALTVGALVVASICCGTAWPPSVGRGREAFAAHRQQLDAIASRFDSDPDLERLVIRPGSRVSITHSDQAPSSQVDSELNALLRAANVAMAWRVEDGVLIHAGSDTLGDLSLEVAFIRSDQRAQGDNRCADQPPQSDYGGCSVSLADDWVLHYEWRPAGIEVPAIWE